MRGRRNLSAMGFSRPGQFFLDACTVLAMSRDQYRTVCEDALKRRGVLHQQVSRGGPHEDFHAAGLAPLQRPDLLKVAFGGPQVEGVVPPGAAFGGGVLGGEPFPCDGGGRDIGHVHEAGDAAGHGGGGFRRDVALVHMPGFAEVHLVVDKPRQQPLASRLDLGNRTSWAERAADLFDALSPDQNVLLGPPSFIDQGRAPDHRVAASLRGGGTQSSPALASRSMSAARLARSSPTSGVRTPPSSSSRLLPVRMTRWA